MFRLETMVGKIRAVRGAKVIMALDPEIEISPIIRNRIYRITQVGSILKVKVGASYVLGHVTSASAVSSTQINEKSGEDNFAWAIGPGEKSLELNLFGEIYEGKFERGVTSFPDIDSEVHVIDEIDLKAIYFYKSSEIIPLVFGELGGGISLPAILDLQKFVIRHGAIVGSTGAGKSNAVSVILREIASERFKNSKVIVTDIHGEYSGFLKDKSSILSLKTDPKLILPYWLLPFDELYALIMGKVINNEDLGIRRLKDMILQEKINWANLNDMQTITSMITSDSPIPFDLRKIWYELYVLEYATYNLKTDKYEDIAWEDVGEARTMKAPTFKFSSPGGAAPFKRQGPGTGTLPILEKLRSRCLDRNYEFIFGSFKNEFINLNAKDVIELWLNGSQVTILDLSNVPSDVIDTCVGAVSRIIFDLWRWGRDTNNFGRNRPIYLVFDEAHLYLNEKGYGHSTGSSIRSVSRILREGRKYGVGALIVSQRPSDINETIFSQIGTIISLRLNNASDLGRVKESLSDNLSNMADIIPSLRTGEAFVSGEATALPIRARFIEIKEKGLNSDPKISGAWDIETKEDGLDHVIQKWIRQGQE